MNTIVSLSKPIIILGIRIQLTDSYISWIYSPPNDNKNTLAGTLLAINFQALIPAIFKDTRDRKNNFISSFDSVFECTKVLALTNMIEGDS